MPDQRAPVPDQPAPVPDQPAPVPDQPASPAFPALVAPTSLAALDAEDLAAAIRPLWEDAGPLVAHLVGRAVSSWEEHISLCAAEIAEMTDAERVGLLGAHPRIGAPPGALAARSALSHSEQGGSTGADPRVLAELEALNDRYEAKFGFPFVAWVAGRSRSEMVTVLRARLGGNREDELAAGCAALVAIARDRLARLSLDRPSLDRLSLARLSAPPDEC